MKKLLQKKGFTLVEVLIVVVIIGILAALIMPRLLSQPERAVIAEAHQFLGVIKRAQITLRDSSGATGYVTASCTSASCAGNNEWQALGLQGLPAGTHFTYACTTTDCTATRLGGNFANSTIAVNIDSGTVTCGGGYQPAPGTTGSNVQCVPGTAPAP